LSKKNIAHSFIIVHFRRAYGRHQQSGTHSPGLVEVIQTAFTQSGRLYRRLVVPHGSLLVVSAALRENLVNEH
jgi:hypothetical protein